MLPYDIAIGISFVISSRLTGCVVGWYTGQVPDCLIDGKLAGIDSADMI